MKKFIPLGFAVLAMLATFLPFATIDITATNDDAATRAAADAAAKKFEGEGSPSAWSFEGDFGAAPGVVLGMVGGLIALLSGAIAATRLSRALSIPTALFALLGLLAGVASRASIVSEVVSRGVRIAQGPGAGFYLLLVAFAGLAAAGILGIVRPEPRASAAGGSPVERAVARGQTKSRGLAPVG